MERPCATLSEISCLIQNCGRKGMVSKWKRDAMLYDSIMRWERFMYCRDCEILPCTYTVMLYPFQEIEGQATRRDRSSAGGFFVRLIPTKFIEEEIPHLSVDWKPPLAYITRTTHVG